MADNPSFGSFFSNSGAEKKKDIDYGWSAYSWSPYQWAAYGTGVRLEPTFTTAAQKARDQQAVESYWANIYEQEEPSRRRYAGMQYPSEFQTQRPVQPVRPAAQTQQPALSLGEKFAQYYGKYAVDPIADVFNIGPNSRPSLAGFAMQDFGRSAYYQLPQLAASGIGSIIDLAYSGITGKYGDHQTDYTLAGNRNQKYNAPDPYTIQGIPRVAGQFVPDIALSLGTTALVKAGMTAVAPNMVRAATAMGARPMTLFGRFGGPVISPAVTATERAAFTAGAMAPTLASEFPEAVSGRETPYEMLASTALAGYGGAMSAGAYVGGTRLSNTISDVGANLASNLMQSAAYNLPGGRQLTSEEVVAGQAYGAALGTMFGVMQKPTPGLRRRVDAGPQTTAEIPVTQVEGQQTPTSFSGPVMREAEMAVYGRTNIPETATSAQSAQGSTIRPIDEVQSIRRMDDGTVESINEYKVRTNAFPEGMSTAAAMQAAHLERRAYADALVKTTNPDALISLLDLNRPAGSPPDVVAQAIIDEVLVQPGKGINAVEARLAQASLPSPLRAAPAPQPVIAGEPVAPVAAAPQPVDVPAAIAETPITAAQEPVVVPETAPVAPATPELATQIPMQPEAAAAPDITPPVSPAESVITQAAEPAVMPQELPTVEAPQVLEQFISSGPEPFKADAIIDKARDIAAAASGAEVAKVPRAKIRKRTTVETAAPARKATEAIPKAVDQITAKFQEGSQQNRKTADAMVNSIAQFINGGEIDLGKPLTKTYRGGGRVSVGKDIVEEMSGLSSNTIKRMVDEGVTFFADDAIKVEKIGDNYIAKFTGNREEVIAALESASRRDISPQAEKLAREADIVNDAVIAAKETRNDVQEMFTYMDRLEGSEPSYAPVYFGMYDVKPAAYVEALDVSNATRGSMGVADLSVDDSGLATNYTKWLRKTGRDIRQSADEIRVAMDGIDSAPTTPPEARLGVTPEGEVVTPQVIGRHLLAKYGPVGFRDLSARWLEINTTQSMRDHLNSPRFQVFESRDPRFIGATEKLLDSYMSYSDDEMLSAFRRTVGKIEDAKVAAKYIADKISVDDPDKVRELYKEVPQMPVEEQVDLTNRIAELANTEREVADAVKKVQADAQYQVGRDDWTAVDKTLYEDSKRYNWSLRNVPTNTILGSAATIYIANEYIDKLEDDETYFGVPGRTLKRFLGSQNAGYAVAGIAGVPGMKGMHKSAAKVGTRFGHLIATLDSKRQGFTEALRRIDQGGAEGRFSLAQLPPEQFRAAVEEIVYKNYSDPQGNKYVKGTPEFESRVQEVMLVWKDSETLGIKPVSFTKAEGATRRFMPRTATISNLGLQVLDYSQMVARNTFFRDHIDGPRNEAELTARNIEAKIAEEFNKPFSEIRQEWAKYKDGALVDAIVLNDFLQTDININRTNLSPEVVTELRKQAANAVRDRFFKGVVKSETKVLGEGTTTVVDEERLDTKAYEAYLTLQRAFDVIRGPHYGSLVGLSEGVSWYDARAHAVKLSNDLGIINSTVAAIDDGLKAKEKRYEQLRDAYNKAVKANGREAANALMPEYKMQSRSLKSEISNDKLKLKSLASDIETIQKSLKNINDIDQGVKNSQESGYIIRHRDGNAAFVLRLEYDEASGLVGERREFNNAREAREAELRYARRAVEARRVAEPGVLSRQIEEYERKIIEAQEEGKTVSPKLQEALNKAYERRARSAGYKPLSEMTDLEIRQELDGYGVSLNLYDNKTRKTKATAAASKAVMAALMSANQLRGKITLGRTMEGFLPSKQGNPKGNETLVSSQSGDVMMYTGDDAPSIDGLIDAMESHVDGVIDRAQFRKILEENLTYRDQTTGSNGKTVEAIWIDMVGLRAIASRYLEPSIPNLARRNNIEGYYNPDGNWTAKQKWDWLGKGAEIMQSQIAGNTQRVIMRPIVADAIAKLRQAQVNNGLIEYLEDFAGSTEAYFDDPTSKIAKVSDWATRFTAVGTLALSVGSYITNRGYGIYNARSNFGDNVRTRYGLQRMQADGTMGQISWYSNQAEADYEFLTRQEKGEAGWTKVTGYSNRNASLGEYAWSMFGTLAPETTLKLLARNSPYYRDIYNAVERANIKEGTIVGNYALGTKVPTGSLEEKAQLYATKLLTAAERQNNYTSALLAAESARVRLGLTDTDWILLTKGGQNDIVDRVVYSAKQRIAQDVHIGSKLLGEIDALEKRLQTETNVDAIASIRRELLIKQDALSQQVVTPEGASMLLDIDPETGKKLSPEKRAKLLADEVQAKAAVNIIMKNIIGDRRFEQGGWTKADMTKIERTVKSYAALRPFMVFTAPVFRQVGSSSAMFYRALRKNGTKADVIKRYARVLTGVGVMASIYGIYAVPTMIMPWFAVADIANMVEFFADLFEDDDGDKLNQFNNRTFWEKAGGNITESLGFGREEGEKHVRATFTDGLVKYVTDINVGGEAGIIESTRMPFSGLMISTAKNMQRVYNDYGKVETAREKAYLATNLLPSSYKRLVQSGAQLYEGQKLDRYGNPIMDPFSEVPGRAKNFGIADAIRQVTVGKRWSEIRSSLTAYEGGTPVITPEDKVAFASQFASLPYIKFTGGTSEQAVAANFENDASDLQRLTSAFFREKYRPAADSAKALFLGELEKNVPFTLPDGNTMTPREIMTMVGASGNKAEFEVRGSGTQKARNLVYGYADRYAYSKAAAEAVRTYYGGMVGVQEQDEDFSSSPSPFAFMMKKLAKTAAGSYKAGSQRRSGRE